MHSSLRRYGFTLIEILVVISIIGILAAVVLANFADSRDQAKSAKAAEELKNIRAAFDTYRVEYGVPPNICSLCGFLYDASGKITPASTYGWASSSWETTLVADVASRVPAARIPVRDPWDNYYAYDNNYHTGAGDADYPSILCSLGPDGILQTWNYHAPGGRGRAMSKTDFTPAGDDLCVFFREADDKP